MRTGHAGAPARRTRCRRLAALAGFAVLATGCAPAVPGVSPASEPSVPLTGRPGPEPVATALEHAQSYGPSAEVGPETYRCAAEQLVADDRISDETLRALAALDQGYRESVADLDSGEADAVVAALNDCLDLG